MIWQLFLIVNLRVLLLYELSIRQASFHLCRKKVHQSASFGTISTLNEDFAAFVFFFMISAMLKTRSQLSKFHCFLFCVMPGSFPRLSVVVSTLFLGRRLLLFIVFVFRVPF